MRFTAVVSGLCLLALTGSGGTALAASSTSEANLELYKTKCQSCHLADGNSPLEPLNFVDGKWTHGSKPEEVQHTITDGVAGTAMLPFKGQLTPEQIAALASYVRSFDKALRPVKAKK